MQRFDEVAFAGDDRPPTSSPPGSMPPARRFARRWLAEKFRDDGTAFRPFERWSEIATALVNEPANA